MAFSPDSDANYQAFLAARAKVTGAEEDDFTEHFIKFLCQQATATGTINSTMVTSAISNAKTALKASKYTY